MSQKKNGPRKRSYPAKNSENGKTLLTDGLIEKICQYIRRGAYVETACAMAGISKETWYDWLRKAAREPSSYPQCVKASDAWNAAMAEAEFKAIEGIANAAEGRPAEYRKITDPTTNKSENLKVREETLADWRAHAWFLERRHPKKWAKREKLEVSGLDGAPIEVVNLSPEEKKELLAVKLARLKELGLSEDE